MNTKRCENILKNAHLRCTPARMSILSILSSTDCALSQTQIARTVPKSIDKVTIYRTLEKFVTAGIAHKAFMKERTWHFELAVNCSQSQCHPHFTCKLCNKTFCFATAEVEMLNPPENFDIHHQKVLLEGICSQCSLLNLDKTKG